MPRPVDDRSSTSARSWSTRMGAALIPKPASAGRGTQSSGPGARKPVGSASQRTCPSRSNAHSTRFLATTMTSPIASGS
jgi:hypothetical protein